MMVALAGEALVAVALLGGLALDGAIRPTVNKTVAAANDIRIVGSLSLTDTCGFHL